MIAKTRAYTQSNQQGVHKNNPEKTVAAVDALIAQKKPDVVRITYEELGGELLKKINFDSVKRIASIGNAARAFHKNSKNGAKNRMQENEELSVPEVIIWIEPPCPKGTAQSR